MSDEVAATTPQVAELARLRDRVVGISIASLEAHVALWGQQADTLAALRYELARGRARTAPAAPVDADVRALMQTRVRDLSPEISGPLAECVAEVEGELTSRGITWRPTWYLGTSGYVDGEFWTADRARSINIPWYLGSERVWRHVNEAKVGYTKEDVMRVLRHEVAHALNYAFELWRRPDWAAVFGNFEQPYRDEYEPDPSSDQYVKYLHESGPSQNSHYAQKHPDEDWAETFAVWLDPASGWRERYAGTGALAKLGYVDGLANDQGALYGDPRNPPPLGQQEPFTNVPGTVGDFVGGWSASEFGVPAGGMVRREAALVNEVELHRLYFSALGGWDGPGPGARLETAVGGRAAWERELRACAAATEAWVVTCWLPAEGRCRTFALLDWQGPPAGAVPILALDCNEHAWWLDHPGRKDLYVAAWLRNLDWAAVERELDRHAPERVPLPTPAEVLYEPPVYDQPDKRCSNCALWGSEPRRCALFGEMEVAPDAVCGYHVPGSPGALRPRLGMTPLDPAGAGFLRRPTRCGTCSWYRPDPSQPDQGLCVAVRDPSLEEPAEVESRGCCARWQAVEGS